MEDHYLTQRTDDEAVVSCTMKAQEVKEDTMSGFHTVSPDLFNFSGNFWSQEANFCSG